MSTPSPAYQPPPSENAVGTGEKKTLALTSLILGIAGLVGMFIPYVNFLTLIGAVVGLILGIKARKREPAARGMALAGIITSAAALAITVILLILGAVALAVVASNPGLVNQ